MEKILLKHIPLVFNALTLIALVFLFTGCTNPTRAHQPLETPQRSKGEIVKYEGADMKVQSTKISFESKTDDSLTMFQADRFCYDQRNDYLVFPTNRSQEGYYLIVPKDSVTLCKNGYVRNNSHFSRNHLLRGFTIGAIIGGGIGAIAGLPMAAFIALLGDGSAFEAFWLFFTGLGTATGAATGAFVDPLIHQSFIDDIQETCPSYFTEEEQKEYLNKNLCY